MRVFKNTFQLQFENIDYKFWLYSSKVHSPNPQICFYIYSDKYYFSSQEYAIFYYWKFIINKIIIIIGSSLINVKKNSLIMLMPLHL